MLCMRLQAHTLTLRRARTIRPHYPPMVSLITCSAPQLFVPSRKLLFMDYSPTGGCQSKHLGHERCHCPAVPLSKVELSLELPNLGGGSGSKDNFHTSRTLSRVRVPMECRFGLFGASACYAVTSFLVYLDQMILEGLSSCHDVVSVSHKVSPVRYPCDVSA